MAEPTPDQAVMDAGALTACRPTPSALYHPPYTILPSPSALYHPPFTIRPSPSTLYHPPLTFTVVPPSTAPARLG